MSPSGILTVPQAVPQWQVIELPVSLEPFATSLNMVAQAGRDFSMAGVDGICMVLNLRLCCCCCCNDVALMNAASANWASLLQKLVRNCELYITNMRKLVKLCKTWRGIDLQTSRILSEMSTLTLSVPGTNTVLQFTKNVTKLAMLNEGAEISCVLLFCCVCRTPQVSSYHYITENASQWSANFSATCACWRESHSSIHPISQVGYHISPANLSRNFS